MLHDDSMNLGLRNVNVFTSFCSHAGRKLSGEIVNFPETDIVHKAINMQRKT